MSRHIYEIKIGDTVINTRTREIMRVVRINKKSIKGIPIVFPKFGKY